MNFHMACRIIIFFFCFTHSIYACTLPSLSVVRLISFYVEICAYKLYKWTSFGWLNIHILLFQCENVVLEWHSKVFRLISLERTRIYWTEATKESNKSTISKLWQQTSSYLYGMPTNVFTFLNKPYTLYLVNCTGWWKPFSPIFWSSNINCRCFHQKCHWL